MRRAVAALAAALACAPAAHAAAPVLTAQESGLTVVLAADSAVHWDFGDGQAEDGQTVSHTYAKAGRYAVPPLTVTQGAKKATAQGGNFEVAAVPQTDDMKLEVSFPDRPVFVGDGGGTATGQGCPRS